MVKSKRLSNAVVRGLLVLFTVAGVLAESSAQAADDELLAMVPAESVFCVRVNNFDHTAGQIDQFLVGVSPIPMGVSMLVRMQFANVLGSPELNGVNMGDSFAIFGVILPGESTETDPISNMFIGGLVPVTDYEQFISGNPNCGEPDAEGVSKIASDGVPVILTATQVGNYALITVAEEDEKLVAMAESISTAETAGLGSTLDVADTERAVKEGLWAYVNAQQVSRSFGPMASAKLEQAKMMMGAMEPSEEGEAGPAAAIMDMDFEKQMEEIRSLSLSVTPKPNALTITATISAVPGTEMADKLVADSAGIRELIDKIKAREPGQMGSEMSAILALLPEAGEADFVGTYNLMNLFKMATAMAPMPLPQMDIATKSNIAFAGRVGNGQMTFEIALPKEHLAEVVTAFQMTQQQMTVQGQLDKQVEMKEQPMMQMQPGPSKDKPAVVSSEEETGLMKVQVGGVRLVRHSDFERGVTPLGQSKGYTLSLIAELPEPVIEVSGGMMKKVTTDTGRDLLPEHEWGRKIKFPKLAKDNKTVVFDVELLLPDEGAGGLQEVSGTLEYLTAGDSREVDLGIMALEAGAEGGALGAVIRSVEADPWRNNATVLGLRLDLQPEEVDSVEFYAQDGTKLDISQSGYTSIGRSTTFEFSIKGELPPKGRIVLNVFDELKKNEIPFKITNISLTGGPF